jgi:hypothetical protein
VHAQQRNNQRAHRRHPWRHLEASTNKYCANHTRSLWIQPKSPGGRGGPEIADTLQVRASFL